MISEPEAYEELLLMNSHVSDMKAVTFQDRIRQHRLAQSDVLNELTSILSERRNSRAVVVHLGKILCNSFLRFMDQSPEIPSGLQLKLAVKFLAQKCPPVSDILAPLAIAMEPHSFGGALEGTEFIRELEGRTQVYFTRLADVLNLTRTFIGPESKPELAVESVEDPALFELESWENPFELEGADVLPAHIRTVVKFLVKLALAEGGFNDPEKDFVAKLLEGYDVSINPSQFERLMAEAAGEPLKDILSGMDSQPEIWRERLLMSGMLLTAADGNVDVKEKKLLFQSASLLGLDREAYGCVAKTAMGIIRSHREPQERAERVALPKAGSEGLPSDNPQRETLPPQARPAPAPQVIDSASVASGAANEYNSNALDAGRSSNGTMAPDPTSAPPTTRGDGQSIGAKTRPRTTNRTMFYCPACHMPQMSDFDECPQCGIILSKINQKTQAVPWESTSDEASEPIVEATTATAETSADSVTLPESNAASPCQQCGQPLSPSAKFCTECGTRIG